MISMDKQYTTRDGREVRLYAVDAGGVFPVHGAYLSRGSKKWVSLTWNPVGRFFEGYESSNDLIEKKAKYTRYLVFNKQMLKNCGLVSGSSFHGDPVTDDKNNVVVRVEFEA
jgi:hypothetical protein